MAYSATVLQIMIASPGDVAAERKIVRETIHEWNDVNAAASGVVLAPVGWETSSSPELGARPQQLINERLLKYCDLLVGVFWTRLGTPTGVAASGTVEEIEEHMAAGKPAMIYFSNRPVAPESLDPESYAKLREFKDRCNTLGLIESFEDQEDFQRKFSRHLQLCLNSNPHLKSLLGPATNIEVEDSPSNPNVSLRLSTEAITLLKAAASTKEGLILRRDYIGGGMLSAGGTDFGQADRREHARWISGLEELVELDLARDRGYKGQIFELTHLGWTVADEASQETPDN